MDNRSLSAHACFYGPFGVGDILRGSRWEQLALARSCQFLETIPLIAGAAWFLQFRGVLRGRC